jgi:hypothetical protein
MRTQSRLDRKRSHQAILHLHALALIGLSALDLEEVLVAVLPAYVEVDTRCSTHLLAEVAAELLPLVERVGLSLPSFQLANPLGDEFAREDGHRTRKIERLLHVGVNLFGDHGGDALMQIAEGESRSFVRPTA